MAKLYNLAGMSTATTGTGTITLGSALYGHLTFAQAGVADGETVTYAIKDGANSEIGRGVYTSSGTTLTRTPLKSTNSNSAINLSGTAEVFITPAAEDIIEPPSSSVDGEIVLFSGTSGDVIKRASATGLLKAASGVLSAATPGTDYVVPSAVRETLSGSRTYYVRTDGSDSNNGLTNTSGGAFLTWQKAWDTLCQIDTNGYTVTLKQGNSGTLTTALAINKSVSGGGAVIIEGDTSTPSNCVLSTTGTAISITAPLNSPLTIQGLKIQTATTGTGISCTVQSKFTLSNMEYGACANFHISLSAGAVAVAGTAYTISGGGQGHVESQTNGIYDARGRAVTITGVPAWSVAFAYVEVCGRYIAHSGSFTGSATGPRYYVANGGLIFTNGAGTSYLPGNASGTGTNFGASPWGQYS